MKAVELGQEFIFLSFLIEDGKRDLISQPIFKLFSTN